MLWGNSAATENGMVLTLRLQANYLKSERNEIKKRHLSHIRLSIHLSNCNVPQITMNVRIWMCVCVCVQGVLSVISHYVATCSLLLSVPPEHPALLFMLKKLSGREWVRWSWTLCLAAPTRDAGSPWIASISLINSSAGWTEMQRYRQWKERSMFQNTLLFLVIRF